MTWNQQTDSTTLCYNFRLDCDKMVCTVALQRRDVGLASSIAGGKHLQLKFWHFVKQAEQVGRAHVGKLEAGAQCYLERDSLLGGETDRHQSTGWREKLLSLSSAQKMPPLHHFCWSHKTVLMQFAIEMVFSHCSHQKVEKGNPLSGKRKCIWWTSSLLGMGQVFLLVHWI